MEFHGDRHIKRWRVLVQWLLMALAFAAVFVVIAGFVAALLTGEYPSDARDFLVAVYRYDPSVQAYVGPLTDQYPPFGLTA